MNDAIDKSANDVARSVDLPQLVLASASPRRAELLAHLGLTFTVLPAEIDESRHAGEEVGQYVARLARQKARTVLQRLTQTQPQTQPGLSHVCIGADTIVALANEILGKPRGQKEAEEMLMRLSGRTHQVHTGVCVAGVSAAVNSEQLVCVSSQVSFREVEPGEADWYWRTGEPSDKAGGYGIQGIGGIFVQKLTGSYSAVVGLPLVETRQLLRRVVAEVCDIDLFREQLHG